MSRIAYCPACAAHENGIKSRIALEHTCGLDVGEVNLTYRGQNHHCKACEEEASGIKNIKAAKHTCKKS